MCVEEKDTNPESVEVLDFQAILNSKIFLKKLEKMLDFIICYMLLLSSTVSDKGVIMPENI